HTEDEEKAAFAAFVDWVYKRWKDDPSMHIYHYAAYEKSALRKLTGKHAICAFEVDELLRHEVMVDLYAVLKKAIRVGEPRYSLKNIEHLYKEKRKGDVATAVDSIVFYQRWLEEKPNGASDWKDSPILADIRAYNKEDCDSTWQLATWLRDLQKQSGITWKNPNTRSGPDRISESAQQRTRAAELAETLLQKATTAETSESRQLHALIANVMEFHWREAKPVFWARFDRREMSDQELFEDSICLAGLERTSAAPTQCQKSIHYEYSYDPEQETKIDVGDECFYAHDLSETVKVVEIDGDKGHIVLSRSIKRLAPPEKLNLIQNEFVSADEIAQAIYRIGSKLIAGEELPQSLTDFIARRPPRIADWRDGPIVDGSCDLVAQTCSVISRLESTTLCIQGPPGSGKTYTASKAIIELLKSGKTVGVTSNSHKAIANLIDAIADKCDASSNVNLRAAKIQSQKKDFHVANARVMALTPAKLFAAERGTFNLIGGTAWAFCKPEAEAMVDYLFVDEAGQVSIANLVGMSASARNIVLIGDQMQLAQPLKGTHPADSGQSTLEYLLGDRQVIPSDFGIFLGTSFRMHPDICSFISGSVYENRLYPHPSTKERVLILPPASAELAPDFPPAGVFFHPVSHDGNAQDSCEEADAIAKLVSQLLLCSLTDGVTIRPVTKKDILVVAPFNMQVRRLH
ncbi:MAG TPA: ribonuclease H-like domain-containing protein, partial [Chroococcales cyanobacterium]